MRLFHVALLILRYFLFNTLTENLLPNISVSNISSDFYLSFEYFAATTHTFPVDSLNVAVMDLTNPYFGNASIRMCNLVTNDTAGLQIYPITFTFRTLQAQESQKDKEIVL